MFKEIIFWVEFPNRMDWNKINLFLAQNKFKADIGIAVTSKEDYLEKKQLLDQYSNLNLVRAWPTLPKEQGYWFSSHTVKAAIDMLDQYAGIPIKLDIEPPIPQIDSLQQNTLSTYWWFTKMFFSKGKNQAYLFDKIKKLSKTTDIMLSTFPFPKWSLKRLGTLFQDNLSYNFIFYTSFFPKPLRFLYRTYMKWFIPHIRATTKNPFFAIGCITPGIFNDEPTYETPLEMEKDIKVLIKSEVENLVVFRLGSFIEKEDGKEYLNIIKKYGVTK